MTNTRVGNGQGINLDIGNGYTANLYSNLEYKEIIVQPINAYVKTGPGKGYSVSKYGSKSRYWGYQYMYSGLSYAGSSELTDWFGLHFSDYGYQYNRWRVANGGSNYGYIPTSYFNVRNYTSNGENAALHLKILNKSPEITATTTQTYYSGQDLTTDMLKSGIIANDREDGKYVLNGTENKLRMEISSKEVTISNDKINTKNLDGSYQFTVKVTDTAGASTTSNLTVKFIKNTAPTISGIKNDEEKSWMLPLLEFRNYIAGDWETDRERRDFRRRDGHLTLFHDKLVHGPYKKAVREEFLRRLLQVEEVIHNIGPEEVKNIQLIQMDELRMIRKIWLEEYHEFDDSLPAIYEEIKGIPYDDGTISRNCYFGKVEFELLHELCKEKFPEEELLPELLTSIIDIEAKAETVSNKRNILNNMEKQLKKCSYCNEGDAENIMRVRMERQEEIS